MLGFCQNWICGQKFDFYISVGGVDIYSILCWFTRVKEFYTKTLWSSNKV